MATSAAPTETTPESVYECPSNCKPAEEDRGKCGLLMSAYILAGLAMMLNIRLSYSSAPYALIRFRLPENLFSVFVRRMASSLELWCLPAFIIADAIELAIKLTIGSDFKKFNTLESKELKFNAIIVPSIVAQWLNFLTYVILFFVYLAGDDKGHLTTFYWTIAVSGFVFGINNVFVFAADYNYIPIYIAGENCFPALTSFIHYITTLIFGNRRKWDSDFIIVFIDILVAIIISLVAAMVWTHAYGFCRDATFDGTITYTTTKDIKSIIITYIPATEGEATEIPIIEGTVNITTYTKGTVADGYCAYDPKNATPVLTTGNATITPPKDGKTTLTIDINITDPAISKNTDKLDVLQALATPHSCNVYVDTSKKTLTIKYAPATAGGCTVTEITLKITDIKDSITKFGPKDEASDAGNATIKVDPPPNHLFIKYQTTDGTEKTKGPIKAPAKDPDAETYYQVTDPNTKIRYSFKLTEKLSAGTTKSANIIVDYGHIFAEGFGSLKDANPYMISPLLIVLVGMGLVYAIYPGIAPGMIVPFYLVDKIEMVLLIATIFPPVIIALLQRYYQNWSPKTKFLLQNFKFGGWRKYHDDKFESNGFVEDRDAPVYAHLWHFFDLLIIIMIFLSAIFIYSLHYRESNISRSIVNQPKMSTALTIVFYMCHEISLAVGFPGMVANAAEYTVLAQMIGAFLMVFLALYSEGYIIEYKSHDPAH